MLSHGNALQLLASVVLLRALYGQMMEQVKVLQESQYIYLLVVKRKYGQSHTLYQGAIDFKSNIIVRAKLTCSNTTVGMRLWFDLQFWF